MNALIFAAGLGTRLGALTQDMPKAMVMVGGKPMLQHAIEKLIVIGVKRIIVNVHHHASQIEEFIHTIQNNEVEIIISDERGELLETGGGLLKAAPLFIKNEPIILYNSDVLTGVSLQDMVDYHHKKGGIATLMVKKRETSRYFLFDEDMQLNGWTNISTGEKILTRQHEVLNPYAFSGIHIVQPEILSKLGEVRKFSITKGYLNISSSEFVYGWKDWNDYWFDVGTQEKLAFAEEFLGGLRKDSKH